MDSLREQEKDCRLYEAICLAVLSEQDLQKLVNKARWDEEDEYWVIPFTKRKSFDAMAGGLASAPQPGAMAPVSFGGNGNGSGGHQRRGSRDGITIPNSGPNSKAGSRLPSSGHDGGNGTLEDDYGEITFQNGSSFADIHGSSVASMGGMPITNGMEGIVDMGAQQVLPASINTRDGDGTSMLPSVNLPAVGGGGTNGNMSRDGSKKQLTAERESYARRRRRPRRSGGPRRKQLD